MQVALVQSYKKVRCVCEWHKWFKERSHVKITKEDNAHHFL